MSRNRNRNTANTEAANLAAESGIDATEIANVTAELAEEATTPVITDVATEAPDDTAIREAILAVGNAKLSGARWIYVTARDGSRPNPSEHWTHRVVHLYDDGTMHYGATIVEEGEDGRLRARNAMRTDMEGRGEKKVGPCRWRTGTTDDVVSAPNAHQCIDGTERTFAIVVKAEHDGYSEVIVSDPTQRKAFTAIAVKVEA